MPQDKQATNRCRRVINRATNRVHHQSQMLLAQDTRQVTRVEPHWDTKPFQGHQLQQHMFMFEGTALLARQEHCRMSSLVWEFA